MLVAKNGCFILNSTDRTTSICDRLARLARRATNQDTVIRGSSIPAGRFYPEVNNIYIQCQYTRKSSACLEFDHRGTWETRFTCAVPAVARPIISLL